MTTLWADDLSTEYQHGRTLVSKHLRTLDKSDIHDAQEASFCNSMIRNSKEVEEWLSTGRDPNSYGGIDKRSIYHRNSFDTMEGMNLIPDITEQLSDGPAPLSLSVDSKRKLADIFMALSPRERQCYILHNAQRLSMREIAEELQISKGTVQDYLKRAKAKVEVRK